jgi:hypothetical protein
MQASGNPSLGLSPSRGPSSGGWLASRFERGRAAAAGVNFPVIFIVLLSLALFGLSVFVVYRFLVTSLKSTTLVPDPVYLFDTTPAAFASSKLPALNGREYAVSFWMYSAGVPNQTGGVHQEFITFKGAGGLPALSVVQDKQKNRVYFVALTDANNTESSGTSATTLVDAYLSSSGTTTNHVIIPVDYVPLQRWVNLCMVVDQDVVTVYMDGDIYNVHVTSQQVGGTTSKRSIVRDPTGGDVVFNNSGGSSGKVRAYISRLQFFNYALSVYHTKSIYNAGPTSAGVLSWLGLTNYKLQWPIVEVA